MNHSFIRTTALCLSMALSYSVVSSADAAGSYLPDSPYKERHLRSQAATAAPLYPARQEAADALGVKPLVAPSTPVDLPQTASLTPLDALPPGVQPLAPAPLINTTPQTVVLPEAPLYPKRVPATPKQIAANAKPLTLPKKDAAPAKEKTAIASTTSSVMAMPSPKATPNSITPAIIAPSKITAPIVVATAMPNAVSQAPSRPVTLPEPSQMPTFKPYATIETQKEIPIDPRIHNMTDPNPTPMRETPMRELPMTSPRPALSASGNLSAPDFAEPVKKPVVRVQSPFIEAPQNYDPTEQSSPRKISSENELKPIPVMKPTVNAAPMAVPQEEFIEIPTPMAAPQEEFIEIPTPMTPAPALKELPPQPPIIKEPRIAEKPVVAPPSLDPLPSLDAMDVDEAPQPKAVAAPFIPNPEPSPKLSSESKKIIDKIPSNMDKPKPDRNRKVKIQRFDPDIEGILNAKPESDEEVQTHESAGVSIKVKRPAFNPEYELEKAYNTLMAGQTEYAIDIYKDILKQSPSNQAALFGLATTYHRVGQLDVARPLYGKLLSINPKHRDALNNFLVLISEESPEEGLRQLEKLEAKNPDYSPIPAQMGLLLDRMGSPEAARKKLIRAVALSPENLAYKYNLAILMDRQEMYSNAAELYGQLLKANDRGESLPTKRSDIQERLTFIVSNKL